MNELKKTKDKILENIEAGKVSMHSKTHFLLKGLLLVFGIAFILLVVAYLISFIVFVLKANGLLHMPGFGLRACIPFLMSLPWLLIITSVGLIVVVEILVRKFSFGYRTPILYSALGAIVAVGIGGALISLTPLHHRSFEQAQRGEMPFMGKMYRGVPKELRDDMWIGSISATTSEGFRMTTKQNDELTVIITKKTRVPRGYVLIVGDWWFVFGENRDGVIEAYGARQFDPTYHKPLSKKDALKGMHLEFKHHLMKKMK